MAQHFLLSAAARSLSVMQVARMSEEEAFAAFEAIRFVETDGEPFCVWCGCAVVHRIKRQVRSRAKDGSAQPITRRIYKCANCARQSSVTSQTLFASHKLPIRDILFAIALFTNGAKGISALQLSRDMRCSYKTAFVLGHKIRESLTNLQTAQTLTGEIEVDATYTGGYVKPANEQVNRRDRRRLENQSGRKKCVIAMRERGGRTLAFVAKSEKGALPKIIDTAEPGSIIYADEAKAYDQLHAMFEMRRIDHSKRYAEGTTSTNQVESFFSRFKRSVRGVFHHVSGPYLQSYVGEMAWRETNSRMNNGDQFITIIASGLHHPISREWKGYWQRRRKAV